MLPVPRDDDQHLLMVAAALRSLVMRVFAPHISGRTDALRPPALPVTTRAAPRTVLPPAM